LKTLPSHTLQLSAEAELCLLLQWGACVVDKVA